MTRALLIVDVQNDFCEGGALAVAGGTEVARRTADLLMDRPGLYTCVFASQDWHNPLPDRNGGHFAPEGEDPDYVNTWPVHCVAHSYGAAIQDDLMPAIGVQRRADSLVVIRKGQGRPDYSAFQGTTAGRNSLGSQMLFEGVTSLDIVGIATDHCVYQSTLGALEITDAVRQGPGLREVRVITDLTAGVAADSTQKALTDMVRMGAKLTTTNYL